MCWISLSCHHPAQVRCCVVNSVARGGRTRVRRVTSRKSGLLAPGTRTCTCVDVHAHEEVGWWRISLLPCAPCAMCARSGRGRHARGREERCAPPPRTPPPARPASTGRYVWRTRALFASALPADSARPAGRCVSPGTKSLRFASGARGTRPRAHKRRPSKARK